MTGAGSGRVSQNAMAHFLMVAVVMLWGAMFVLIKVAVDVIAPQWFNAIRMMIAFLCLALIYRKQLRQLTREAWLFGGLAGASLALGYVFQTQGIVYTTATNSAFITALVVVIVPILASIPGLRPPGHDTPEWTAWAGALVALMGVALLTLPENAPWTMLFAAGGKEGLGNLLTLFCAVGFSLYVIALAHASGRARFEQLILLQIGFAMVLLTIAALIMEPVRMNSIPHLLAPGGLLRQPFVPISLLIAGILATALAFGVQTWAQQVIPAANIAVILTLEPVFAWLTAFLVLKEKLKVRPGMGAILVLLGIVTAEILPRWRKRTQRNLGGAATGTANQTGEQ
ncbi:MAG TPA: DMT family transporter [Acidobacteriaceae bacterium]|nr:DMT family transporter [Acidobacteriaceae bacterium]